MTLEIVNSILFFNLFSRATCKTTVSIFFAVDYLNNHRTFTPVNNNYYYLLLFFK